MILLTSVPLLGGLDFMRLMGFLETKLTFF